MKKVFSALLISVLMLFTVSCDLFMDYEKPALYIVTVGLNYRHVGGLTSYNILDNTQNDADAIDELFTGFADQAGMEWYSVTYRDSYPVPKHPDEMFAVGTAELRLKTSSLDGPLRNERKDLNQLITRMEPDRIIMNVISDLLYHTRGVKAPTKNDIIVFYYAGHGMDYTGDFWWIPSIFPEDNDMDKALLSLHDELMGPTSFLSRFPGHKVVLLDSCFSGNLISDNRDTINGGLGGNGDSSNNPYYDSDYVQDYVNERPDENRRGPVIEGGGSRPETPGYDDFLAEQQAPANTLVPEYHIITSASSNQTASDGEDMDNSPFVYGIIEELQPGWQLGDPVRKNRRRILLSDIYKAGKKSVEQNVANQDPQTPLTRYDIVLFDFTR